MSADPSSRASRIPAALQAVFLASNRGKDIHKPPPERMAQKVFMRNWGFQRGRNSGKNLIVKEEVRTVGEKYKPSLSLSPQVYLDTMLYTRGYSNNRYKTLQSAYYNSPTDYQKACYGPKMLELVKSGNTQGITQMMRAGLSPNPCNAYGESLVHMACRRGNLGVVQTFCSHGANLQVADDYGRTPMHDACWAPKPAFDVVRHLIQDDARLFYMMDRRGSLPLEYVHKDHWSAWREFLDTFVQDDEGNFPQLDAPQGPPPLTKEAPNSRPLPDPHHAMPIAIASMVASGKLSPVEASLMAKDQQDESEDATVDDSESDSEYDSDDSDYDSDSDDEEDMEELMGNLNAMMLHRRGSSKMLSP